MTLYKFFSLSESLQALNEFKYVLASMFARLSGIPEGELFQNEHGTENKLFNSDASSSPLTAKNVGNSIEWLIGQLICLCFLSAPNKSFER